MRWRRHRDDGEDRLDRVLQEQDRMRSLLDEFLAICEREGARLESAARDSVEGVPPGLIAASRTRSAAGEPVMVTSGSGQAIAVTSPGGDPRDWWEEISRHAAGEPSRGPVMVRLAHADLPAGLLALAVPGVTVTVSSSLPPAGRRQAVRTALSAARRARWMPGRVPAFMLPVLAGGPLGRLAAAGAKVHALAAGAAAVATAGVVTAVLVAAPPVAVKVPYSAGSGRPPAVTVHRHRARRRTVRANVVREVTRHQPGSAAAAGTPDPVQTAPLVQPSGPQPSSSPVPSLTPSPSPSVGVSVSPSPPAVCLGLLVLGVCVNL